MKPIDPRSLLCPVHCAQCANVIAHMPAGMAWSGPEPICMACTGHHPRGHCTSDRLDAAARLIRFALLPENLFFADRWIKAALQMKHTHEMIHRYAPVPEIEIDLGDLSI